MRAAGTSRGFSLLEVSLSLAILSILLGAMGSLIVIAAKAVPDASRPTDDAAAASRALEELGADLSLAVGVVEATGTRTTFVVPDRDGDGVNETIGYEWTGGALERTTGDGVKTVVAGAVKAFALEYWKSTATSTAETQELSLPEASVGGWTGVTSFLSRSVDSGKHAAQGFTPTLPAGTRTWTITRVRFLAQRDLLDPSGMSEVQIRTVDSTGAPTGTILGRASIAESSLAGVLTMSEAVFTGMPPLAPSQEVAIVFVCTSGCPSMVIGYSALGVGRSVSMWTYSASWSGSPLAVIPHEVYATTTADAPQSSTSATVGRVAARLRVGVSPEVRTTIVLANAPGVQ